MYPIGRGISTTKGNLIRLYPKAPNVIGLQFTAKGTKCNVFTFKCHSNQMKCINYSLQPKAPNVMCLQCRRVCQCLCLPWGSGEIPGCVWSPVTGTRGYTWPWRRWWPDAPDPGTPPPTPRRYPWTSPSSVTDESSGPATKEQTYISSDTFQNIYSFFISFLFRLIMLHMYIRGKFNVL